MLAERAALIAELRLDDKMSAGLARASNNLGKLGKSASRAGKLIGIGLAAAGAAAAYGIAGAVQGGIASLKELEDANTATAEALKVSGLAARVSGEQIRKWSEDLETASDAFFDDKDIQRAANTLIRFGNVSEENLQRALTVATDLGTRFGSVEGAASQLARALADPTKATRALRAAGVSLTKAEQDKIKALVESGKIAEAQAIILGKLEAKTKGAAKAAGGPYTDAMNKLRDAQERAQQAIATGFLPVLTEVADFLNTELSKPGTLAAIEDFGKGLAGGLRSAVTWARQLPWGAITSGLRTAAGFAKTLIEVFTSMPPEAQATIIALVGLNKLSGGAVSGIVSELGKGLIKGVLGMSAGVVNIKAAVVNSGGLPGGKGGGVGNVGKAAGAAGTVGTLTAALGVGAVASAAAIVLYNVVPEIFRGPKGSSGPTTAKNRNPAQAGTAVWGDIARNLNGVWMGVKPLSGDIKASTGATLGMGAGITAGLTTLRFLTAARLDALNAATAAGDERTGARIDSLRAATSSGLNRTANASAAAAAAIRNKRWSVTVPVTVQTSVSVRTVNNQVAVQSRYGNAGRVYEP